MKQIFNSLYGQTANQRANKYCMTTFEAIIYNRKEIEQMKKTIKIIKYILGYAVIVGTFDLMLITALIKMQVIIF